MKYYGRSKEVAESILQRFEAGDVPSALAQVFIHRKDDKPVNSWSWSNQMMVAFSGTCDARGYKQWQSVGRTVKGGARAVYILGPIYVNIKDVKQLDDGTEVEVENRVLIGFKSIPVFKVEDTDIRDQELWNKAGHDIEADNWLANLPLRAVADAFGLQVNSYNGNGKALLGFYGGSGIGLGTENLSTWTHELMHAADDKLNGIMGNGSSKCDMEVVAELGGAVLLSIMGNEQAADLGGCLDYIKRYAPGKPVQTAMKLIDRVCKCVDLILSTADAANIQQAA